MTTILTQWPLAFVCVAMIVAAVIDGWKLKVPNWLTFPLILSGWVLGLVHNFDLFTESTGTGGIGASLAGTALGFILLYPVYAIGGMGAGDVKMQMGFGSWVGAYFGLSGTEETAAHPAYPGAIWIILIAFAVAVIVGGVMAACMILIRGQFRRNLDNTRAILGDLVHAGGVGQVADKAKERKPRMHLLPYGIPLCVGFVGYLFYLHGFGF
jgi:prepilin peptidase CpaA